MTPEGTITSTPFGNAWQPWRELAGEELVHQNPLAALCLLERCDVPEGTFQMELRTSLGINQSYVSKLVQKLAHAGWVTVTAPESGRGRSLVKTTASGRRILASIRAKLRRAKKKVGPTRVSRGLNGKWIYEQVGQLKYKFPPEPDGEGSPPPTK